MRGGKILTLALLLIVVAGLGLQAYTQTADEQLIMPLRLPADTQRLVLIFHGSEDGDDPVLEDIAALIRRGADANTIVINYNWSPASDNRLRAQANARELGAALALELSQFSQLRQLELVAHSAGAYVPDALCEGLRWRLTTPPSIRTIYLDPFGLKGLFAWNDGANWHGHCADFALAIINTDDPAPATNQALALAYNIDITEHPGSAQIARNGHYWPLHYFAGRLRNGSLFFAPMSHASLPRGSLVYDNGVPGSLPPPLRD
jgi:hypothetical protein